MSSFLFQYYPEDILREILQVYHTCTGLHVQLLSEDGGLLINCGNAAPFCVEFMRHLPPDDTCLGQHLYAGRQALRWGESYLFSCHAGLIHIVYPILNKETMFGSVIAGPFLMDEPDASLVMDLEKKYAIDTPSLLTLSEQAYKLPQVSPDLANEYARLLYHLMKSVTLGREELLNANKSRLVQQSRISESIQMYKNSGVREQLDYPLDLEYQLITKIKTGDLKEGRRLLNELLGYLLLYENHDVEAVKVRIAELCSLLSRAAIERGSDVNRMLDLNEKLMQSILSSQNIYDICYTFQDNIDIFTESLFYTSDRNSQIIRKATEYIASHYAEELTLTEVADAIHLNPTYLSTLFKQVTGHSFKTHLNEVRIQEAQRLLKYTDYSILEISIACGFSDQSYFTKVFRKFTGMTPKQYR